MNKYSKTHRKGIRISKIENSIRAKYLVIDGTVSSECMISVDGSSVCFKNELCLSMYSKDPDY